MTFKIIDPHLHFFALDEGDYHWLVGDAPPPWPNLDKIKRTHTLSDLLADCPFELKGLVHIEAGFDNHDPARELAWLAHNVAPFPYKAIAYAKIDDKPQQFKLNIAALTDNHCIGIRDITEGDDALRLAHPNTLINLQYLASQDLHFEAQGHFGDKHYRNILLNLCHAVPKLTVILTHFALLEEHNEWEPALKELANVGNVVIKYSGQEMLKSAISMQSAFEGLLRTFGADRVMLASNYPVCLQKTSYSALWHSYQQNWPDHHSFEAVSYLNAQRIYRFDISN